MHKISIGLLSVYFLVTLASCKNEATKPVEDSFEYPTFNKIKIEYLAKGYDWNTAFTLARFSENDWIIVDVDSTHRGWFEVAPSQQGLYTISKGLAPMRGFIVGALDSLIKIEISDELEKVVSNEHPAYEELRRRTFVKQMAIDSMETAVSKVSKIHPQYYTIKEEMRVNINERISQYNDELAQLREEYPYTFAAQVLAPLFTHGTRIDTKENKEKFDNDHAYNHLHYFDDADFSDPRIMTHPMFFIEIDIYLERYMGEFEEDFKNSIDLLIGKTGDNQQNKTILSHYLISYFDERAMHPFSNYILENHLGACPDDALMTDRKLRDSELESRILQSKLQDIDGKQVTISQIASEADATLVLVWKTTCPHCREELPLIKQFHEKYATKGLEILGVAIDEEIDVWQSFSEKNKIPWWNTYAKDEIRVPYTPYIFIIDNRGKTIARHLKGHTLKEFLVSKYNTQQL